MIYMITNLINGKKYVGQTKRSLVKRWAEHVRGNSGCSALKLAIKEFGSNNFKIEEIFQANSLEQLCLKERELVLSLGTMYPNGYNLTTGGSRPSYSKEDRELMSLMKIGTKVSEDTRKKMSESHFGIKKPEGFSKTMSSVKSYLKIRIFCDQTNMEYESVNAASRATGVNPGHISRIVKGTLGHSKGYTFKLV